MPVTINGSGPVTGVTAITGAGLDLIATQTFSAASSVSVNNCFSATYDNYRVLMDWLPTADMQVRMRFRVSGADDSSNVYVKQNITTTSTTIGAISGTTTSAEWGLGNSTNSGNALSIDLFRPALAVRKTWMGLNHRSDTYLSIYSGIFNAETAFTGMTLFPNTGNFTGTVTVYGYRKA